MKFCLYPKLSKESRKKNIHEITCSNEHSRRGTGGVVSAYGMASAGAHEQTFFCPSGSRDNLHRELYGWKDGHQSFPSIIFVFKCVFKYFAD